MMMMMMMMNCFCAMVDQPKAFTLISSWDHCQKSSLLRISKTPQAGFKSVQNLSLALVEWSCTVVIPAAKIWKYLATWEPEAKNIFEIDIALINFLL